MAAAFASRILRSQLFGVTPVDPLTFVLVPAFLLAVAALACLLPARRDTAGSDSGASSGVACRANCFPFKRVYNFLIWY